MDPRPRLVLQTGIAGALPDRSGSVRAKVGDVVIATQEAYSDTGSSSPGGWLSAAALGLPIAVVGDVESGGVFPVAERLTAAAVEVLSAAGVETPRTAAEVRSGEILRAIPAERPRVLAGPCVTASLVTGLSSEAVQLAGRWGALAESMEGAAAAHICALYEVPFLEVRGISNLVADREREAWEVERAVDAASWAAQVLVGALDRLPLADAVVVPSEEAG
jgi:futalosine hydrolase